MSPPIEEGKFVQKLQTFYTTPKEAIAEIKYRLKRSRKIRINTIPMGLLLELLPRLKKKDLKIILPEGEILTKELEELGECAISKVRIFIDYMGDEVNAGSVCFSDKIFNRIWRNNEILAIISFDYLKCVKCMVKDMFETSWQYSKI